MRKLLIAVGGLCAAEAVVWTAFKLHRPKPAPPWEVEAASLHVISSCLLPGCTAARPTCRNCIEALRLMDSELPELTRDQVQTMWECFEPWKREAWRREALSSAVD